MLVLLSPSKSQDFSPALLQDYTLPRYLEQSAVLMERLRQLSVDEIRVLMAVSHAIAELNAVRYATWQLPFTRGNSKQALLAFTGDVYGAMDIAGYSGEDFSTAQSVLCILSGLYGLLRPLDLIQPYRLEMKTRLQNPSGHDLYVFWKTTVTAGLNRMLSEAATDIVINLASQEYFGAIERKNLNARIITPVFKDYNKGSYRVVALFAKRARGAMADSVVRQRIASPYALQHCDVLGYQFNPGLSSDDIWVFTRG